MEKKECKEIIVLGGGISGCSIAYYLKERGYNVTIIEQGQLGGLCATNEYDGVSYEFGPHICYANDETPAYDLFHKLLPEFKPIKYFPKQSINGKVDDLATFPITVANVLKLPEEDRVKAIEELYHVNLDKPSYENFEEYVISRVGRTMYEYCYKNYNTKQWGIEPADMDSEWAKFRNFFLRSGDYGMFGDKWQGHPGTYNGFFSRLVKDINIVQDRIINVVYEDEHVVGIETEKGQYHADVYISTLPIDMIMNEADSLQYRGITKLYYLLKGESGLPTYLCTFPNNYPWTRITDYVLQAEQECENTLISFAVPHSSDEKEPVYVDWQNEAERFIKEELKREILGKMVINQNYVYPISSAAMLNKFDELIRAVSKIDNLISFGRLGLYSYISMCTAIDQAYNIADDFDNLLSMNGDERYRFYTELRRTLS